MVIGVGCCRVIDSGSSAGAVPMGSTYRGCRRACAGSACSCGRYGCCGSEPECGEFFENSIKIIDCRIIITFCTTGNAISVRIGVAASYFGAIGSRAPTGEFRTSIRLGIHVECEILVVILTIAGGIAVSICWIVS